jgi:hypothetical protein
MFLILILVLIMLKGRLLLNLEDKKDGGSENVIELIHTDICGPIIPAVLETIGTSLPLLMIIHVMVILRLFVKSRNL